MLPGLGSHFWLQAAFLLLLSVSEIRPRQISRLACEGSWARLSCGAGEVISVVKANYGRLDGSKCAARRPKAQIANTQCSNPANKVSQTCNGKRQCSIRASNSVFGDPCGGTYKYLEVDFVCKKPENKDGKKNAVTCEGSVARLRCGRGKVITVVKANYGRLDRNKCSRGRPKSQLNNVACKNPANKVSQKCNGKRGCNIRASNSVFGDPCGGTYKYLEVDYVCKKRQNRNGRKKAVTCEGSVARLRCGRGKVITVVKANYGRLDRNKCSRGRPKSQLNNVACKNPANKVSQKCNGKRGCNIRASNSVFGDPCGGIYKYLEVDYVCKKRQNRNGRKKAVTCEGSVARLRCGRGKVITVVKANYGRLDRNKCSRGRPKSQLNNVACKNPANKVSQKCNGKRGCNIRASNSVFGDPCGGIYKYLEVDYVCKKRQNRNGRKKAVTCEGSVARLRCGRGKVITVRKANYGRLDRNKCSRGRPKSQLNNVACKNPANKVSQKCNGKRGCNIRASNSVFGDPCGGTYKYLEVDYVCKKRQNRNGRKKAVTCEGSVARLRCGRGKVITVVKANYGRLDRNKCSRGRPKSQLNNVACKNPANKVSQKCNGKRGCNIRASNSVFGDPCGGIYKYLEVDYVCKKRQNRNGRKKAVTCEGSVARLRCGRGKVITVVKANYGRLDRNKCSRGRPKSQLNNVACKNPANKVSQKCNGKRGCNIRASNSVFGDPCGGIYKYLEVDYVCKKRQNRNGRKKAVTCEGSVARLRCGRGKVITVVKANYGRLDRNKCSRGRPKSQLNNVACKNPANKVSQKCNGKRGCNIRASNSVFGDPCGGIYKYLEVDYVCKKRQNRNGRKKAVTCEGSVARLRCGRGKVITVVKANYGRLDRNKCSRGRPKSQLNNVACKNPANKVSQKCNGKRGCNIRASNSVFGDPCGGIYKYLEVDYVCKKRQNRNGRKKAVTCEGSVARLRCGRGKVITVVKANYGRLDRNKCSRGRPKSQLNNVACKNPANKVSQKCNGKRGCNIRASNSVFGDPCGGIYKYLEVDYVCKKRQNRNGRKKAVTCEGSVARLRCGRGKVITVVKANYGRLDRNKCSRGRPKSQLNNVACKNPANKVSQKCNGKRGCNIRASNSVFGDPCGGTYKYLEVDYVCKKRQNRNGRKKAVTCEGSVARLRCGRGKVITVRKANYGRLDRNKCSRGRPKSQLNNVACKNPANKVSQKCNGKRGCNIRASNSVFGDPCGGIYKYLEVDYVCKKRQNRNGRKKAVTCEGSVARLRCGRGKVITVRKANYGRLDRNKCSRGRPKSQLNNVACKNPANKVSQKCNGKRGCNIRASNSVFGDPCGGIYKYLEVDYVCKKPEKKDGKKKAVTCEGSVARLRCGRGKVITVRKANYGRLDRNKCSRGRPKSQLNNVACKNPANKVSQKCDGTRGCNIRASNSVFGDPCRGTYKYLEVDYVCEEPENNGGKTVTCEGSVARLRCGRGKVITVVKANYGRLDRNKCSRGRPKSQLNNVACKNPANKVSQKCNGKRGCNIRASNSVFGDPCGGIYKYLEVDYVCKKPEKKDGKKSAVTCEGSVARLRCGRGKVITVVKANYGRLDRNKCSRGRPKSQLNNVACKNPANKVSQKCDGKRGCNIRASNSVFGDPCRGTYKYLEVDYVCQEPENKDGEKNAVTCEGSVARLRCGRGKVITVVKANYGRLDRNKCSRGRPKSQLNNVACKNPANKVSQKCDGKRGCNIRASNSVFGDPCRGTYKYLEVDYVCQEPESKDGDTSSVTCEGSMAQLRCDAGQVISVVKANYGRVDEKKCSRGRPKSQLRNVRCKNPAFKVSEKCDGKQRCFIKASNSVFGDPCRGTYKYLEVDYVCQEAERKPGEINSVTCEGSVARLKCDVGQVISILEANYGRLDSNTCSKGRPKSQLRNVRCSNPANQVSQKCDGRRKCNIRASNGVFGDPCRGTYKYLAVDYICQEPERKPRQINSVTCEGSKAQLKCGPGKVISVVQANYGRLDRNKCSRGRPKSQLNNVACKNPANKVSQKCDGKRRCSISARNSVFGDPCGGIYKYLEVDYVCQEPEIRPGEKKSVTCEGATARLKCDPGKVISVVKANYGRLNGRKCAKGKPKSQLSNVQCSNPASQVSNKCDGKQSCSIRASNSVFGDPCGGTYKYLEVDYVCQAPRIQARGVINLVSCEGAAALLKCDDCGVISVKREYYGRRDRTTCANGRPASQLRNDQCFNPTGKVAESCDGKTSCIIRSSNSVFGDPCGGTYKYLEVDYTCELHEQSSRQSHSVTCEGAMARFRCEPGQVISVLKANYGRLNGDTCAAGRPRSQLSDVRCSNPANEVSKMCNGRSNCSVSASNSVFGDPCGGTYKYLEVDYMCLVRSLTCEGNVSQIKCSPGKIITVLNAVYGRSDQTTCPSARPEANVETCSVAVDSVAARCNRKNSCFVAAKTSELGEPCEGTSKYLVVDYLCETNVVG